MKMDDNDYIGIGPVNDDIDIGISGISDQENEELSQIITETFEEINRRDKEANKTRPQFVMPDTHSDEFMQKVQAAWGPFEPKGIRGVIHGLKHSSRDEKSDIISSVIIIGVVIIGVVLLLKWIF
jgi:hypothetical protein